MRREEGDNVTRRGDGRGLTGVGEVMGSEATRTLSEDLSPRSGPEILSGKVRAGPGSLQTLKVGGD